MASSVASFVAIALLAAALPASTTAQSQTPSCVSNLIPCAPYLNSTTTPPAKCCEPLKEAVKNELPCLCSLFTNQDLLKSFNIDINQALQIPKHCNITQDQSICKTSASPGKAAAPASTNATSGPPANKNTKNDNKASQGLPSIGFTAVMSLLLLWLSFNA
ncbi:non-specific lipid transfer protein GPI-anchored 8-like [Dioscorea cayenensis subsp. rotundata]|uniref:Non-specific lipid transfer protein GPI-anchored 8-like n=1 Tax=Dioscorea cayennensis subsp. rotundata TaxID=55577 RepID=A0AB40C5G4_DIOCR|nr:non-specific lipid transfer protein GPI-anchored 8-like [Dioscorea cayenensis subsp. rotundata]